MSDHVSVRPIEVIAIFGPTASGKTAVADETARRLGTGVVSADAMQVYRGLPLLTNQAGAATELVAICALDEEMSVGLYAGLATTAIDALVARNGTAVIAGGTGLYLRAALADLELPPAPERDMRLRWERVYDEDPEAAYERLEHVDPSAAAMTHRNDRRRVVRALELAELGSSLLPERDRLWAAETRRPTLTVGLDVPAEELERRIRARTSEMFARGVVAEVQKALETGVSRTAAKTLGLDAIATKPAELACEEVIARTKRYAAYQRKWMRRIPGLVHLDGTRDPADLADEIVLMARGQNRSAPSIRR
jgi:tRNA dimethylallyltransferase